VQAQSSLGTHFAPAGVSTQVVPTEHVVLAQVAGGGFVGHLPSDITVPPVPHSVHAHSLLRVTLLPPPRSQQTG
jgi:hypothetical protein